LPATVARLAERLATIPRCRVFIVDNGSTDGTFSVGEKLAKEFAPFPIHILRAGRVGIGEGYAGGIEAALAAPTGEGEYLVLSAADLPFGFTDLEEILAHSPDGKTIFVGSKAHPRSNVKRSFLRQGLTRIFAGFRRSLLNCDIGDSQGTCIVPARLALRLLSQTIARDFFFSTEFLYHAHKSAIPIVEVPVTLKACPRPSSVRIFRDGFRLLSQLYALSRREPITGVG